MTSKELASKIQEVADLCDESDSQQALKSILLSVLAAIALHREFELMELTCVFARRIVGHAQATRN